MLVDLANRVAETPAPYPQYVQSTSQPLPCNVGPAPLVLHRCVLTP